MLALSWSGFLPPSIWSFSLCRHLRLSGAAATAAPCARLPLADRLLRCTVFTHSQKTILKQTDVPIPDGVKVTVKARVVVVKGPRGEVKKDLTHLPLDITVTKNEKGQDIVHVERWFTSGKAGASIQSACSHIENMIVGVTKVRQRRRPRACAISNARGDGSGCGGGCCTEQTAGESDGKLAAVAAAMVAAMVAATERTAVQRLQCDCKGGGRCGAPRCSSTTAVALAAMLRSWCHTVAVAAAGAAAAGGCLEGGGVASEASALNIDVVGRRRASDPRVGRAPPRVRRPWPPPLTRPPRACARLSPQGFEYKMRFVYAHFPINVTMANKGTRVEIRNFLGEKIVRVVECDPGVTVTRTVEVKDEIVLVGNDINCVSRTAALIQQICAVKRKDIRKFLDGIYVSAKGNVVKS